MTHLREPLLSHFRSLLVSSLIRNKSTDTVRFTEESWFRAVCGRSPVSTSVLVKMTEVPACIMLALSTIRFGRKKAPLPVPLPRIISSSAFIFLPSSSSVTWRMKYVGEVRYSGHHIKETRPWKQSSCSIYLYHILYKWLLEDPEGRGFDSRWCHWNFSLTLALWSTSASNRNEYQEYFLGVKAVGA